MPAGDKARTMIGFDAQMVRQQASTPAIFSIVSAVYNVDRYLVDFFSSLEQQSYGIENLDLILVDDGSTDASLASCQAFAAKYPGSVRVLTKPNGGQGSARNLGLDHVRGDWVTFTDPDDFLDIRYFDEVADFLGANAGATQVVSTSLHTYTESTSVSSASHALQRKFRRGNRVIDLDIEPDCIQMQCSSAIIDAALIRDHALRFDERIRPTFEDAHFVASCLLASGSAKLGVVAMARYNYRKRADASSTINTSGADPDKYTTVPRLGLLSVIEAARVVYGCVPVWVQNMVLYDLSWAFKDDAAIVSATGSLARAVTDEFHELAGKVLRHIAPETIQYFPLLGMSNDLRFVLMHGYAGESRVSTVVQLQDVDEDQGLVKLVYRYTGAQPEESIHTDGRVARPVYAKSRSIEFLGRTIAHERILWVSYGDATRVILDGATMQIVERTPRQTDVVDRAGVTRFRQTRRAARSEALRDATKSLWARFRTSIRRARAGVTKNALFESLLAVALHSHFVRSRFGAAWVFMDKDMLAGDNAEHLYRHVRENQPEVNAWFVLSRQSPDWKRLRRDSIRLVPYGSWRWQLLLLSADVLASSHIDNYVVRPLDVSRFGVPRWKFVFLQHGVNQSDLSRWFNSKHVDLFVTSTIGEHSSITADSSPYALTSKEVKLLGFPRHDSLRAKRAATPQPERNLLLIMPTWRKSLFGALLKTANNRHAINNFAETEYARQYSRLLTSSRLRALAAEQGLSLAFMPHPNMAMYLAEFELPVGIQVFNYADDDVQQVLARAALMITDYSSIAFDAAAIDVPVVYFQFDYEEFHAGGHIGRLGYFDYERDGFGPVCTSFSEVEDAVANLITGPGSGVDYPERVRDTFAYHDQGNSRRVVEAMLALSKPAA